LVSSEGSLIIGNDNLTMVVLNIVDETNIILVGRSPNNISKPIGIKANPF